MECPYCGSRTQVTETRGAFRDRRCTNAKCRHDFTTRENIVMQRAENRLCARTRATRVALPAGSFTGAGGLGAAFMSGPEALGFSLTPAEGELEGVVCPPPGGEA